MKKVKDILFSMTSSVVLLVVFAISIGYATFIENEQGTELARKLIYNALWFEILLVLLAVNLTGSIFRYEIFNKKKFSILLFHLAFILILAGAGITRYFGSEGIMHIREGKTSNEISSDKTSVRIEAEYKGQKAEKTTEAIFSEEGLTDISETLEVGGKTLKIENELFVPNSVETIVPDKNGEPALSLFVMNAANRSTDFILLNGESNLFEETSFAFEDTTQHADILFFRQNDELYFKSTLPIAKMGMMNKNESMIMPGSTNLTEQKNIYKTEKLLFVLKTFLPLARKNLTQVTPDMDNSGIIKEGKDAMVFSVNDGNLLQRVNVLLSSDGVSLPSSCMINGIKVTISYGQLTQKLPFSIYLRDFVLERYPGSNSPSSYASEITVTDTVNKTELPFRIYMNNILKYRGYRFFQSSYDSDEKGTILSVSNDYWGTLITYIGYFLMITGMILTLFNKNSRFRTVLKLSRESQQKGNKGKLVALATLIVVSVSLSATNTDKQSHIKSLNSLMIQDEVQGRIEPFSTFASDMFRKISKQTSYNKMSPTEVILGMISDPDQWQNEPIIKVGNDELAKELGAINSYVTFNHLFDFENGGTYRLSEKIDLSYQKEQNTRSKYDKELINVDERVNICYQLFEGKLLNIFPDPSNENGKWTTALSSVKASHQSVCPQHSTQGTIPPSGMAGMNEDRINMLLEKSMNNTENQYETLYTNYLNAVSEAYAYGNWKNADEYLSAIKNIQKLDGGNNLPSLSKIKLEIIYNDLNLFGKMGIVYVLMGIFLLIFHLINIFNTKPNREKLLSYAIYPFALVFILYTFGLAARWYISDHAPWSNGYETMIFVGWTSALSGLIFARRLPVSLAVTGILSAITLFVANMSWMNPEITNLVPVLKSNWLIIHVGVITTSYGFLAMGALLGMLNLILMITRTQKNSVRLKHNIQQISYIIELTLISGLFMLTIGCFIGGVWANESWGRYWGWDPKETWALVSILVYSAILHLRNVPKLNNQFVLSSLALVGFSSIIMTFFGVNYYLSGMHSYGTGTPPPIPSALYLIVFGLAVLIYWAYKKEKNNGSFR